MNNIKRITALVMAMLMSILMFSGLTNVKAAQTAHVSISSASANVGDEVTITITASSDVKIELCDLRINYDSSILQYVKGFDAGGGGTGRLISPNATSFDVVFKTINPGTATISVDKSTSYTSSADEDYMSLTTSSGSVNVKAPASYSSDNTLKSLQISPGTLSPAFSPDRTTYNATVDATEAVTEDASQAVNNDGTVTIDGRKYSVVRDYSGITIPDGYQEIDYDYNGQKINAVKGIKTGLILMYLESEDGKGGFYIYDETAKTFSPYNTVAEPEITYVVLPITNSLEKPAGYALTRFTMNGKEVQVLMDANRQYCLFYGVSSLGEKGWFRYRISDGSIQAYSVVKSDTANADVKADNGKTSGNSRFWLMIVLILGLIIAVFIVITIVLCSKLAKVKKVFNMASKDGVDLDEYTEKVIDGYAEDEDDSYEELDTSSDKISYGDDKSGKSDVEELKLFDVEDDK